MRSKGLRVVRMRCYCLMGMPFEEVSAVLFLDDETVRRWHALYVEEGSEALFRHDYKGKKPNLSREQETLLSEHVATNVYHATGPICQYIEETFGVTYTHSGCCKLLRRLDFEYKKPKPLPNLPPEAEQQAFIEKYEKLLNGLGHDEVVYFADAVHPEYQVKASHGWFKKQKDEAGRRADDLVSETFKYSRGD